MFKNVTLVFPGQGSQYVGMGKEIDENLFTKANEVLGFDLKTLCLDGPAEELKQTAYTQPAIVTHSVGLFNNLKPLLEKYEIKIDQVLGHSVGEYAALVAAEVLSFEDAVKTVNLRGTYMQAAVPAGKGKMVAILRADQDLVTQACSEANQPGAEVMPANFNDPGQVVISGTNEGCDKALEILAEKIAGKVRAIPLKVSAPFHSALMKPAEEKLENHLNSISFKKLRYSYIANVDAKQYSTDTDPELVKQNLIKQVCGSVLWTQSIQAISPESLVIEVGPGKVLTGLIKKINPELKVVTLDSENGLEAVEEFLK